MSLTTAARHSLALAIGTALAATPLMAVAAPGPAAPLDRIDVVGTGQTRQVQSLGREDLARQPAGSSALKLLGKLPGVHFTSADPWGNYEWSTRLNIRGFNQNQLGFTLDGIPLGDMSYGNHNGLHISRALTAENLGFAEVSQGSGALDTASSSNLGGTVRFGTRGPEAERGLVIAQTVGSDDTVRTFARYDTGELDGFSAFLSGAKHDAEKWKGYGAQDSRQVNSQARFATDAWTLGGDDQHLAPQRDRLRRPVARVRPPPRHGLGQLRTGLGARHPRGLRPVLGRREQPR